MGGPASEALRGDGAKRKSVRKRLPLRGGTPRGAAAARRSLTAAAALSKICGSR